MDWLETIVEQHAELESPQSFWRWGAICAISAVLKDSVWLDRQIYNLYPNIYVMFHADSGLKKGPPVGMATRLVNYVGNTRVITGRSSIQGILKELGVAQTEPGGKIKNAKAVAFIASSELSSSIVEDKVAADILTDLYDRQYRVGEWRSLLKMESFNLKDPTITMLTATNEAHAEEFFKSKDIRGGFYARTFIIYERSSAVTNSLLYPLRNPVNYLQSAEYLKELAKLNGPFQPLGSITESDIFTSKKIIKGRTIFFTETGRLYEDWYDDFKSTMRTQDIKDDTGTLNRFGDSVIKVAMLLSLAKRPNLIIDIDSMQEAINLCETLVGNIRRTTLGKKGLSNVAALKTLILTELMNRENHVISRPLLHRKFWMHFGVATELDDLMLSFHESGMIITESLGNQVIYRMSDEQLHTMGAFLDGKNIKDL